MKKALFSVLATLVIAPAAFAGLADTMPQDAAGFDRNTLSAPFVPVGVYSSNFSGWRDNLPANGDTWLASNMAHFIKVNDSAAAPTAADAAFAGAYRGSTGDTCEVYYEYTADAAMTDIDFAAACTVVRSAGRSARLQVSAIVNSVTQATVYTPYFVSKDGVAPAGYIYVGSASNYFGATGVIGEIAQMSLTGLNIQPGDTVKIKIRMPQNDGGSEGQAKNLGLGVMLPEPATMSLLGVGALALLRRRK